MIKNSHLIVLLITFLVLISGSAYIFFEGELRSSHITTESPATTSPADPKNISYTIDGTQVTLVNGSSEREAAPGSASRIVTRYFGNEVTTDLNADGVADVAFLLTQETGGSGVFYYVVPAIKSGDTYRGGKALFIGDRIAPQTTEAKEGGIIVVNYADRKSGESFATSPSIGKSLRLKLDPNTLEFGEVVPDFEGEADPSRMTLGMKTWELVSLRGNDGKAIALNDPKRFTLTLKNDGTFSATTDCNGVGGTFESTNPSITFSRMMSTLMFCDGSQESQFTNSLERTAEYSFTRKGELTLYSKEKMLIATFR